MKRILSIGLLIVLCAGCSSFTGNALPHPPEVLYQITPTEELQNGLSENEIETLSSLELVDDYPLYTMHYIGEYDESRLTGNQIVPAENKLNPWACTLFTTLADESNRLYGRNFDWDYSPALLLYTDPPRGYASVSVVDLAYFGFSEEEITSLDKLPLPERTSLLDAPWWPFDGMNEHGLVIGMAAVPSGNMTDDPQKTTLGSLEVMRKILDTAQDVDEAVEILKNHNIDMEGGPDLHYLIADRSGRAVLIEFYRGEMVVIPNSDPWHLATNFLCSSTNGSPEGRCWRYDTVLQQIGMSSGSLNPGEGMILLSMVAQQGTQWSVLYNMTTGNVDIVVGQEYENIFSFQLEISEE